jgi:hypothetical protein
MVSGATFVSAAPFVSEDGEVDDWHPARRPARSTAASEARRREKAGIGRNQQENR